MRNAENQPSTMVPHVHRKATTNGPDGSFVQAVEVVQSIPQLPLLEMLPRL
jgi:hypothetical protein